MPYIVARSMLDGTITPASYAPESLRDPKAAALLRLITVREDSALDALVPRQSPNIITATLDDGRVVAERVDDLPGFVGRPMQRADAESKFARNARGAVTPAQITRIADAVWNLDRADSVAGLIDSLAVAA
jgi:2-methylcitrate dehydratase